jgi:hypothetical protein
VRRWWKWVVLTLVILILLLAAGIFAAGRYFEPYIREQAIAYLRQRFDSEVELSRLQVQMPGWAALRLLTRGRVALVDVEGDALTLRHKGRRDVPPLFVLRHFGATLDLQTLFTAAKSVPLVTLDGMEITLPPKEERLKFDMDASGNAGDTGVEIGAVIIHDAKLTILPRDHSRTPLRFDLHDIHLHSVAKNAPMKYEAFLTIPKPNGQINATGSFGPWAASEPSDTPLNGDYLFENADLGVFNGIAGILKSTGHFEGQLGSITAKGEATVPDFRLKMSGNPVPLSTTFEVGVDGTNGNTELKPVHARLGKTNFVTSGVIVKHEGDQRKTISLDAHMPAGNLPDVLRLAMKGPSFMEGVLKLDTHIEIPPLTGKVKEKLMLDGKFEVTGGKFLKSNIQEQIDTLSRKGQGRPDDGEIDEVVHRMSGDFHLDDQILMFRSLAFAVTGAAVNVSGDYNMKEDMLDIHGALSLDAKVSQTQTGWKHWVLKPIDPFFSKNGAGTFLKIKIDGSSKKPQFGLDK